MNIQRLRALRETMRKGSITGAADALFLTQPAVSKLIAALEHEVGFSIFNRQQGRLVPTEEGKLLLHRAERVLDGIDELSVIARDIRDNRGRSIRLACSMQIASVLVPPAAAVFRGRFPSVNVSLAVKTGKVSHWVAEAEFDLGIVSLSADSLALPVDRIFSLPAVAVVRASHPLADRAFIGPNDLDGFGVIRLATGHSLRPLVDASLLGQNIRFTSQYEVSSSVVACKMASTSQGIAIVDRLSPEMCNGDAIKMLPWQPEIMLQYGMFYAPGRARDALVEQFADEILKIVRSMLRKTT